MLVIFLLLRIMNAKGSMHDCCSYAALAALWLVPAASVAAYAQTIDLGTHGPIVPDAPAPAAPSQERAEGLVDFNARAGIATDYIYRGTTLSARQPAVGAAFEAALAMLYGTGTVASVKLPSRPVAEASLGGGIRPKLGDLQFDLGALYYAYLGETPPAGATADINYWEATARADTTLGELLRVGGGFAYSPNVSNTGAWSKYAAFGLAIDLPGKVLPPGVSASGTGSAGYFWFGNQSAALRGFPLPAYLNWNAGITFTRKSLNLDLRYYDTNLSKEECFVLTGDPGATPGGRANPVTNPDGLISRWCGATFVAKFWYVFK
jgi:uncharacterized protein (TIGR02001 family)